MEKYLKNNDIYKSKSIKENLTDTTWIEYFELPNELKFSKDDYIYISSIKPNKKHKVFINGNWYDTPRFQQAYGISYMYSGNINKALPIPNIFIPIMKYMSDKYKYEYNMLLLNWYKDGKDYIGYHSDDERQLVENSAIITISLGIERDFVLKNKVTKKVNKYLVKNNTVLVMGGTCQKTHMHSIPKRLKINEERISITLRAFNI